MKYSKIEIAFLFIAIFVSFNIGVVISLDDYLVAHNNYSEFFKVLLESFFPLVKGIKITDIVSSTSALLTLILAFKAYQSWLSQKINNDSYQYAKNYLSKSTEMKEIIREIQRQYNNLHIKKGMRPITEDECTQRLHFIGKLSENLFQTTLKLTDAKSELQFWVVSLTELFEEKHDIVIDHVSQLQTVMLSYSSQLHLFHHKNKQNFTDLDSEKLFFEKHSNVINETISSRHDMKFNDMFILK